MSQRLGMADGRCFTINNSSMLYNDFIMTQNGIKYEDNYTFRKLLQEKGPEILKPPTKDEKEPCGMCDTTLKLSGIY
jgi:hypothetical protein